LLLKRLNRTIQFVAGRAEPIVSMRGGVIDQRPGAVLAAGLRCAGGDNRQKLK